MVPLDLPEHDVAVELKEEVPPIDEVKYKIKSVLRLPINRKKDLTKNELVFTSFILTEKYQN